MIVDLQIVMSIIGVTWEVHGGGGGKCPFIIFFYLKIDFMAPELKRNK
jgi:hypothetical protein